MVAVSAALASGCAAPGSVHRPAAPGQRAAATATFRASGLTFSYPATWHSGTWSDDVSGFSASIVYLSTSRLHNPCVVSTSPGRIMQVCRYPVGVLPPRGVLVEWSTHGSSAWHLPKANTTIGGRRAVETKTSGGWCRTLRGTETIRVMITRHAPGHWYQMDACLRGPGLPQQEAQVSSMLRSVAIANGA